MIFEELRDNNNVLYSCLSVNKTWSEIIVPILWKDPWKFLKRKKEKGKILFNVIIPHLSEESKNYFNENLKNAYERPSFYYIGFCRHLNLNAVQWIINTAEEESDMKIIKNEVIKLFINENTRFTHLYIPRQFDHQLNLIPGAKRCFSKIEFLSCNTCISDNTLMGLIEICKSIGELELYIEKYNNNHDISKLIESSKKLVNVRFEPNYFNYFNNSNKNESFYTLIENSLNKHASNVQCFKITEPPVTRIFSSFVNLKRKIIN
uniref:F-box domain-containing protein n=1 Tax=Rhizophagus irregularis (strain DAOM 181602 / DAOM 197198 / MUCL 43194) TaxID=747089 RepID=U9SU34_RHIID